MAIVDSGFNPNDLMRPENVLLIQFNPGRTGDPKVIEIVPEGDGEDPMSGRLRAVMGLKIHSIHDGRSEELTRYDPKEDRTDLSCLVGREGHWISALSADGYGGFKWKCCKLGGELNKVGTDGREISSGTEMFATIGWRDCDQRESDFLDNLFPEFRESAF